MNVQATFIAAAFTISLFLFGLVASTARVAVQAQTATPTNTPTPTMTLTPTPGTPGAPATGHAK